MGNSENLRQILSQNIRQARESLHMTQAKLAEYANISLSYLTDIERQRTWVSDMTLVNLARALNTEAYELIRASALQPQQKKSSIEEIADLIHVQKTVLKKQIENTMDDLLQKILQKE